MRLTSQRLRIICTEFGQITAHDICIHRIKTPSTRVPKCSIQMWPMEKPCDKSCLSFAVEL